MKINNIQSPSSSNYYLLSKKDGEKQSLIYNRILPNTAIKYRDDYTCTFYTTEEGLKAALYNINPNHIYRGVSPKYSQRDIPVGEDEQNNP